MICAHLTIFNDFLEQEFRITTELSFAREVSAERGIQHPPPMLAPDLNPLQLSTFGRLRILGQPARKIK